MNEQGTEHQKIITRFAPSPTGFLHAGAYRTGIYSYLHARKNKGIFVLRIEDTDKERSKIEYEENILESLKWLGLEYDVFVRQSENALRHKAVLEKMITDGFAYISKEEAKDGSGTIREIVRFKNPNIEVTFVDEIKGSVTMDTTDLGDFVIAKNINEPLFHLAVVVDDFDEEVTHVIRGEDHVSNTPRQILIQRAIGAPTPIYAHLPLVLSEDKKKLSKRRGALSLLEYRDQGYLPQAILNMVSLVGWNPGTDQEIFLKEDLVNTFDLKRVQKSGALFNPKKLEWINKEHIKLLSPSVFFASVRSYIPNNITSLEGFSDDKLQAILPIIFDHITNFGQIRAMANAGELDFYFKAPVYAKERLFWKDETDSQMIIARLSHTKDLFASLAEDQFTIPKLKGVLWDYSEKEGRGQVLWPLRYALSGREKSPDPFQLAAILGKEETLSRITFAITLHDD